MISTRYLRLPLFVAAATLTAPLVAMAEPFPVAKVDYQASYQVDQLGMEITMAQHGGIQRIVSGVQGMTAVTLLDTKAKTLTTLMDQPSKMAMVMDLTKPLAAGGLGGADMGGMAGMVSGSPLPVDADVTLTKKGQDKVAGLDCTVYDFVGKDNSTGSACLTADNIPLSVTTNVGGTPFKMTATAVKVGPQDAAQFTVPADYQRLSMDDMMKMMGGANGMPAVK